MYNALLAQRDPEMVYCLQVIVDFINKQDAVMVQILKEVAKQDLESIYIDGRYVLRKSNANT